MHVGRAEIAILSQYLDSLLLTLILARCYNYDLRRRRTTSCKLWHFAGSKRRRLLMAGKDGEMFMTRSFNVTPKTTEQHFIARSDKSVAYVTNNKRLCSTFCTIEANYWQTRSIARPLCDSRATCFRGTVYNCLWRMASATPDLRLPSQPKLVLISPTHRGMARPRWPEWLVTYRDSLPARRRSPIQALTGPSVE